MDIHTVYLRRRRSVLLTPGSGSQRKAVVASLMHECAHLGFALAPDVVELLYTSSDHEIRGFRSLLLTELRDMVGASVSFAPMYPNFPSQVMEASEGELYFNAIMHYLGDHFDLRIMPEYTAAPRAALDDSAFPGGLPPKLIRLGSREDLEEMARNLVATPTSLSKSDKDDLRVLLRAYAPKLASMFPVRIEFKENLATIAGEVMDLGSDAPGAIDVLSPSFRTATDILRLATARSGGDISLAKNTKFRSFSRHERRFLLALP